MGKHERPFTRPADLRRAVTEWAEKGFTVKVGPDGSITVTPQQSNAQDDFDLVNMKR